MRLKAKFLSLLALCAVITLTGCVDKQDEPSKNTLKPDQQKEQLEKIGVSLMNEIKPADFQPATVVLADLIMLFESNQIETPQTPMQLKRIIEKRDLAALSQLAQPNSDIYNVANYFGVFTFNYEKNEWIKTDSENELKFVFQSGGKEATLRGVCSAETHVISVDLTIPKSVTFTMSKGTATLLQLEVGVPALELSKMKATAKASLNVGGFTMSTALGFEPTTSNLTASISKGSKTMISFNGLVKVTDLMKPDSMMLNSFNANISLMDQCYIFANCPNYMNYMEGMAKIENNYKVDSNGLYGMLKYKAQSDLLNETMNVYMNFDKSNTKAISLEMNGRYTYSIFTINKVDYYSESYEPIPYFLFSDGSKNSSEEFFTEAAFADLIAKAGQLAQEFANIFGGQE